MPNIPPLGFLIIAVLILVLFGRGKISAMMGEVGKGITAFKSGVKSPEGEIEDASATADASAARDVTPEEASAPASERDNA